MMNQDELKLKLKGEKELLTRQLENRDGYRGHGEETRAQSMESEISYTRGRIDALAEVLGVNPFDKGDRRF